MLANPTKRPRLLASCQNKSKPQLTLLSARRQRRTTQRVYPRKPSKPPASQANPKLLIAVSRNLPKLESTLFASGTTCSRTRTHETNTGINSPGRRPLKAPGPYKKRSLCGRPICRACICARQAGGRAITNATRHYPRCSSRKSCLVLTFRS
jgi:hypothetical protein